MLTDVYTVCSAVMFTHSPSLSAVCQVGAAGLTGSRAYGVCFLTLLCSSVHHAYIDKKLKH